MTKSRMVYLFGGGVAEGDAKMKNLLGGKGANLSEMASLGIPVPAGFTMTTEVCIHFSKNDGNYPDGLKEKTNEAMAHVEKAMDKKFGDSENPLLVSVRSGARQSMPGMMETVLNVGLTPTTIPGMIAKTNNERFVYDAYRRLITMYSDVVMEKAGSVEPKEGQGIRVQLERIMDGVKDEKGYKSDTEITTEELKDICEKFKAKVKEVLGKPFPDDHIEQLWGAIGAVFKSWDGKRAIAYRRIENIPDEWGTAVNVQAMAFGNMGDSSGTGVAFTRNPATGENVFFGEWLINAQGEDVVAGIRTPSPLGKDQGEGSLEEGMADIYKQLNDIRSKLEDHYKDMQDIEFTIEEGKLFMLQTRTGKRNGPAALKIAVNMLNEKMVDKKTAVMRVRPSQLDELLHPMVDPAEETKHTSVARGLPAGPGGATGKIVLTAEKAKELGKSEKVILVRNETSPEDVEGMHAAQGILTAKGGMTSHAALVARGWGKCCIVGCGDLDINVEKGTVVVNNSALGETVLKEGDIVTLNGNSGLLYKGEIPLVVMDPNKNEDLKIFLAWCDEHRSLGIRTNADTPNDASQARSFGAEGIGLTRTEHMFFHEDRIKSMRKMILAKDKEEREKAVYELLAHQKADFKGLLKAMDGLPVTIRLLDPPLHEFLPHEDKHIDELASQMGVTSDALKTRVSQLHESNPMMGHRGCRLGCTYPEITRMQALAILEATAELVKEGNNPQPEIMVPLIGHVKEFLNQKDIVMEVAEEVKKKYEVEKLDFLVGTMIEIPRAALTADEVAKEAEFFSFGTNDLTQMGCGFSRDDTANFLPHYVEMGFYKEDPFQSIDQEGVGQLVEIATKKGRGENPKLKVGICGEHGGDPESIYFFHRTGLDYVSCSPFRVPIARLAAAQIQISEPR